MIYILCNILLAVYTLGSCTALLAYFYQNAEIIEAFNNVSDRSERVTFLKIGINATILSIISLLGSPVLGGLAVSTLILSLYTIKRIQDETHK